MLLRVKIVLFTNLQHLLRTGNRQDSGKLARVATGGANYHVIMSAGMNNLYALVKKPAAIVSAALSRLRQRPGGSGRGEERGKSVRMTEGRDTPSLPRSRRPRARPSSHPPQVAFLSSSSADNGKGVD